MTAEASSSWHTGRSWSGTPLEDGCPCRKGPCGLVAERSPDCDQHDGRKTIRQSHPADRCPGATPVEEPHHRAARQPTDEERVALRAAALDSMRAGLPGLREKAAKISARHGGGD